MHPKMHEQRWDPWPKLHTFHQHNLRLIRSNNSLWWPANKYKIILPYFHEKSISILLSFHEIFNDFVKLIGAYLTSIAGGGGEEAECI